MNAFDVYKVVRKTEGAYCVVGTVDENGLMMIISRAGSSKPSERALFATPIIDRADHVITWFLGKEYFGAGKHVTRGKVAYMDSFEIEGN